MDNSRGTSPAGPGLVFLKLGGSLITDKTSPRAPRLEVIRRICGELADAAAERPQLRILLGHGSGSFGHVSGSKYRTREGVRTAAEWQGFSEVWQDASSLNHLVMDEIHRAGLGAIAFPPSASLICQDRQVNSWNLAPIRAALQNGLIPVVYGDVVFDAHLGGTILSTEELFVHLADHLDPDRILMAGSDPGVWQDYPDCTQLYEALTPADLAGLRGKVGRSAATDVTGGMAGKVSLMLDLIRRKPALEALIFSGQEAGTLNQALLGATPGTRLHS